jgi:hypothetical protein
MPLGSKGRGAGEAAARTIARGCDEISRWTVGPAGDLGTRRLCATLAKRSATSSNWFGETSPTWRRFRGAGIDSSPWHDCRRKWTFWLLRCDRPLPAELLPVRTRVRSTSTASSTTTSLRAETSLIAMSACRVNHRPYCKGTKGKKLMTDTQKALLRGGSFNGQIRDVASGPAPALRLGQNWARNAGTSGISATTGEPRRILSSGRSSSSSSGSALISPIPNSCQLRSSAQRPDRATAHDDLGTRRGTQLLTRLGGSLAVRRPWFGHCVVGILCGQQTGE